MDIKLDLGSAETRTRPSLSTKYTYLSPTTRSLNAATIVSTISRLTSTSRTPMTTVFDSSVIGVKNARPGPLSRLRTSETNTSPWWAERAAVYTASSVGCIARRY